MKNFVCLLLSLFTLTAAAQEITDTTKRDAADTSKKVNVIDTLKKDLFTAPDTVPHLRSKTLALIPPALLVGYGISSFYIKPQRRLDKYIHKESVEHNIVLDSHIEDYFQYAPPILVYGLNLVGVHGKNTFIDRTLIYVMAQSMMGISIYTLKKSTHRLRPDESDRLSFPSGHTANAFAGAEFMSQELSGNSVYYGIIGYAFATTTGVFRIYHQDHWFSDVVAGAGFGILSTKAAYLLYPYIRNRLFKAGREKEKNKVSMIPELEKEETQSNALLLPSYQGGVFGLSFSMQF